MAAWTRPALPPRWTDTAPPRLVGRHRELAEFEAAWASVLAGSRQAVFLGGEPGAGKTRLLREVATRLHDEGAAVLLGTCAREFGAPYQPFVEPVSTLYDAIAAGSPGGGPAPADPAAAARLDGLAAVAGRRRDPPPAVQRGDSGHTESGHTDSGHTDSGHTEPEHQRELYDAVAAALRLAAADRPVLLALEDLQWAGPSALNLLGHVVERTGDARLLVLATYRTTAPDRSAMLGRVVAQLYRLEGVRRLDLAGLDVEDITRYLVGEAGISEHRARVPAAMLREQTGGNPFFLREVWRDLAGRGGLAALRSGAFAAPESVRDTLAGRLERLTAPHRQVVELAAVIGEVVELDTLLVAGEWTPDTTLAALDEAVSFGLIERPPGGVGDFRFPHALARQAVLDLMPSARRLRAHARVAEALELSAGEPPVRALAHHFASARLLGYTEQARHYLLAAARLAESSLAHHEAAGWFEQAADLTEDTEERDVHLLAAARSHLLGADFARARSHYERVCASRAPRTRVAAAIGYESASWRPSLPGYRAVELLTEALALIEHDESDPVYVRALASLGRALAFTGATGDAAAIGERAVALARRLGDERLLADTLQASLWLGLRPRDAPAKLARASELSALAERTGDLGHLGPAAYFRGVLSYLHGDPSGWDSAHRDLLRVARVTGQDFFAYMAGCLDYGRLVSAGRFEEAERTCATLVALGDSFGTDDTEGSYGVQTFMVRRETGALEAVRDLVTGRERPTEHWAPGLLALYTGLGLEEPARRLMTWLLEEDLPRHEGSASWPAVLAFLTEAALALRDEAAARRLRPMLAEFAGLNLVAGQFVALFGSADRYLGSVDSLLGRGDPPAAFAVAEEMDTRMGAGAHLAHTLAACAAHLRHVGAPRARVEEVTTRSRDLAGPLGMRPLLDRLDRLGADTTGRATGAPAASGPPSSPAPAGLTPREAEVLALVGVGLTNRAIAARLVISENTAANHVRSILAKTGCTNRTQAAHYAASRGLLPQQR